jgi:pimeloyl-ACP methyl ester carboxylesterase
MATVEMEKILIKMPMGFHVNFKQFPRNETTETSFPLFIFHHGAGHTLNSFELLIHEMQTLACVDCLCFDARGHGLTLVDDEYDLSIDRLASDFGEIIKEYSNGYKEIILVGKELGLMQVIQWELLLLLR